MLGTTGRFLFFLRRREHHHQPRPTTRPPEPVQRCLHLFRGLCRRRLRRLPVVALSGLYRAAASPLTLFATTERTTTTTGGHFGRVGRQTSCRGGAIGGGLLASRRCLLISKLDGAESTAVLCCCGTVATIKLLYRSVHVIQYRVCAHGARHQCTEGHYRTVQPHKAV